MSKSPSFIPKLFHGTPSDISQSLELPQQESHSGSDLVIFATPDIMCAIAYSLKAERGRDDKAQMAVLRIYTGEKKPPIAIFGTTEGNITEKFENIGGGFLLEIENKDFIPFDPNAETCEWKSTQPAQIKSKHQISSDDAMRFGVQVFLIKDAEAYENASPEERSNRSNLKNAVEKGWLIHVNREKGLNPLNLENDLLEDRSFIDNPNLILNSPSLEPESESTALCLASGNLVKYGSSSDISSLKR
jgi:hypothetical protein